MKRRRLRRARHVWRAVIYPFGIIAEGLRHLFLLLTKETRQCPPDRK